MWCTKVRAYPLDAILPSDSCQTYTRVLQIFSVCFIPVPSQLSIVRFFQIRKDKEVGGDVKNKIR